MKKIKERAKETEKKEMNLLSFLRPEFVDVKNLFSFVLVFFILILRT